MHEDILKYVLANIAQRKLRSWLTILGIIIGITAIVTLIGIAQGLDGSIRKELEQFGTNTIIVTPNIQIGFGGPPTSKGTLTLKDVDEIKRVPGMDSTAVSPFVSSRVAMSYKNSNVTAGIIGVDPKTFERASGGTLKIENGRMLKPGDAHVAVLAHGAATDLFKDNVKLDAKMIIGGKEYKVIGILKSAGSSLGGSDNSIYVPIDDAREALGDIIGKNEVTGIWSQVAKDQDPKIVAARVEKRLEIKHKVKPTDKDFSVLTSESIQQQIGAITGLLTAFLGGVAAISLIVGGVGVANTMFMSVMERTREIGILKAVGARKNAIMEIFLIESGLIGLMGGLIGVALGILISLVLSALNLPSAITLELAGGAIFFSVAVGAISGYFPARRAAQLQAVEALRYE
jgi:putative ABC transport system permease protein